MDVKLHLPDDVKRERQEEYDRKQRQDVKQQEENQRALEALYNAGYTDGYRDCSLHRSNKIKSRKKRGKSRS